MAESFDKLLSQLKSAQTLVDKMVAQSSKFSKNMNTGFVSNKQGRQAGEGAKTVFNGGTNSTSSSTNSMSTSQGEFTDTGAMSRNSNKMDATKFQNQSMASRLFGRSGSKTYNTDLATGETGLTSQNFFGLSDTLRLMSNMQGAINTFLPGVKDTMNMAAGYYNANVYQGGQNRNNSNLRNTTYDSLNGGITSAGSDAQVGQFLSARGLSANTAAYKQTLNTVKNAARYMNIENMEAAQSIEGLTSGQGSANMLKTFGIYTADLSTGKEKTQGEIFKELAGRLTAGRGQATQDQTMASIRRGALGATIEGFFQGDKQGAQMFKQYMIDSSKGGNNTDLSKGSVDGINPLQSQMDVYGSQSSAMNDASGQYIQGINLASKALSVLQGTAGALSKALGAAAAASQTLFGDNTTQGLVGGAKSFVDYTSKGINAIEAASLSVNLPAAATVAAIEGATMAAGLTGAMTVAGGLLFGAAAQSLGGPDNQGMSIGTGGSSGGSTGGSSFDFSVFNGKTVYQKYGNANGVYKKGIHSGTDYAYNYGDAVKSVGDGTVTVAVKNVNGQDERTSAGKVSGSLGNYVAILHSAGDGDYTSFYGHLSSVLVNVGDQVTKGQVIGKAGNTGGTISGDGKLARENGNPASGSHLHFDLRKGRQTVAGVGTHISNEQAALLTGTAPKGYSPTSSSSAGSSGVEGTTGLLSSTGVVGAQNSAAASMGVLAGLYSGNTDSMIASLKSLSGTQSLDSLWKQGLSQTTGSYSPLNTSGVTAPTPGGTTNNNVSIVVQVPDVTAADAVKFGQLVKQYLDENSLMSNTGRA